MMMQVPQAFAPAKSPTFDLPNAVSRALTGELTPDQAAAATQEISRSVQSVLTALSGTLQDKASPLDASGVLSVVQISAGLLETAEIISDVSRLEE